MQHIHPLPETVVLRTWWIGVVAHRPFVARPVAVSVAEEARVPGAGDELARLLAKDYGLTHEETTFWWIHEEADKDQGRGATGLVSKLAQTDEEPQGVRETVGHTLALPWRFFDGLALAYGEQRRAASSLVAAPPIRSVDVGVGFTPAPTHVRAMASGD